VAVNRLLGQHFRVNATHLLAPPALPSSSIDLTVTFDTTNFPGHIVLVSSFVVESESLSLQLATESSPVHQRHCTSSEALFTAAAYTPPQPRLHDPRTRLNISLLALAPSPLHLTPPPLTFDISPPLHRGLSCASELHNLFFHTHPHKVYVYMYISN
jgi:hypothetical protein